MHQKRLAAGLHPDPLGELKRSPDPLAAIWGLLLREEEREGEERKGMGRGGEREKRKGEWRAGSGPHRVTFTLVTPLRRVLTPNNVKIVSIL